MTTQRWHEDDAACRRGVSTCANTNVLSKAQELISFELRVSESVLDSLTAKIEQAVELFVRGTLDSCGSLDALIPGVPPLER